MQGRHLNILPRTVVKPCMFSVSMSIKLLCSWGSLAAGVTSVWLIKLWLSLPVPRLGVKVMPLNNEAPASLSSALSL